MTARKPQFRRRTFNRRRRAPIVRKSRGVSRRRVGTVSRFRKGRRGASFGRRKRTFGAKVGGKSLKLSAYKVLQENRKFTETFDANFQSAVNTKTWVFMTPSITPVDVAAIATDWNASQNRQFTAGTAPINRPFKIYFKEGRYSYLLKNSSVAVVRGRQHTFVVRENTPNTTTANFNTSSPLTIWNDGLTKQLHFDGPANANPALASYQWWHNHRFCSFFKHVGASKTHVFRPQDPAKRFTYSNKNRLLDPLKLDTSVFTDIKGMKFHVWEFIGELGGDIAVTWTGTGTTSHGGTGPVNMHYLGEQNIEYSVLSKPMVVYDQSDLRTLQVTNAATCVPMFTPVAGPSWDGAAIEYVMPLVNGMRNVATAPPLLP